MRWVFIEILINYAVLHVFEKTAECCYLVQNVVSDFSKSKTKLIELKKKQFLHLNFLKDKYFAIY